MTVLVWFGLVLWAAATAVKAEVPCNKADRPNIVIFMADDLGFKDVSYRKHADYMTPNIDAMAACGIVFPYHYSHPMCTPSRAALLTGCWAHRTGLQVLVIFGAECRGLPLNFTIMPQYFKSLGYSTHIIGKWHLGSYKQAYHPTCRGFDSFLGFLTGHIDYYNWIAEEKNLIGLGKDRPFIGFDAWNNTKWACNVFGQYLTHVITNETIRIIEDAKSSRPLFLYVAHAAPHAGNSWYPLQAPLCTIEKHGCIKDPLRRIYAAMVQELDDSLGRIVEALHRTGKLCNTIILFLSDNGGTEAKIENNVGSNFPLRGMKMTVWEGGTRTGAILWYGGSKKTGYIYKSRIALVDWLYTLYAAAGGDPSCIKACDGMNFWDSIQNNTPGPRDVVVHNIDYFLGMIAVTFGEFKLIFGASLLESMNCFTGRFSEPSNCCYNASKVVNSRAGRTFREYTPHLMTEERVHTVRKENQVNCCRNASSVCIVCKPDPCLFHITIDPCELNNVAKLYPEQVAIGMAIIANLSKDAAPPSNMPWDRCGDPQLHSHHWTNFGDCPCACKNTSSLNMEQFYGSFKMINSK